MKRRDRKRIILCQLGQEAEPITLSELLDKLGHDCTERTLRRWLNELINENSIKKSGNTRGAKYYIATKASLDTSKAGYTHTQVSNCFGTESLMAIRRISRPLFERQPVTYNTDWLDSYEPNQSFYLSETLRKQLQKAGQRANRHDPAGTYAHQIFNRLIIDLSYNSSRLEGNTYSLLDTEKLLLHGDSPQGKLDEEKVMILNHKEAIRYLVDNAPRVEANRNVVCTLHYLLSDGLVEPQYAGKVRDYSVRIGGSTYLPFEDSKRLQLQLDEIMRKAQVIKDPFEQSLFLLVHISYLQAFADVNKRTARLSANIPLITGNLVPLAFSDVEVKDYMSAIIAIYELQDVRPIADLYVYSYMRTCAAYDSTVKALGFDEVRVRYRQLRRSIVREIILQRVVEFRTYIQEKSEKIIPKTAQKAFLEDVLEDLEQLDYSRIAGLGVSLQDVDDWLELYRIKKDS